MTKKANMHVLYILSTLLIVCTACQAVVPPTPTTALPPTITPTAEPTRPSEYQIYPPSYTLTQKQEDIKNNQASIAQWHRIEAWLRYWLRCDTPPLDPFAEMYWELFR